MKVPREYLRQLWRLLSKQGLDEDLVEHIIRQQYPP
jgi:hypothetical protein